MACTVFKFITNSYAPQNMTTNGGCWFGLRNFSGFIGIAFFPQEWVLTYTTLQSQLNRRTRTVQLQTKHFRLEKVLSDILVQTASPYTL